MNDKVYVSDIRLEDYPNYLTACYCTRPELIITLKGHPESINPECLRNLVGREVSISDLEDGRRIPADYNLDLAEPLHVYRLCQSSFQDYITNKITGNLLVSTPKKVIFNYPATIVLWNDGTKTVVKCSEDDIFSPEAGLAMCYMKKLFGNDNEFHKIFKKYCPKQEIDVPDVDMSIAESLMESVAKKFVGSRSFNFKGKTEEE